MVEKELLNKYEKLKRFLYLQWYPWYQTLIITKYDLILVGNLKVMGVFWLVIKPFVLSLIYIYIFGYGMHARGIGSGTTSFTNYGQFAILGVFSWTWISGLLPASCSAFMERGSFILGMRMDESLLLKALIVRMTVIFLIGLFPAYIFLSIIKLSIPYDILVIPLWAFFAIIVFYPLYGILAYISVIFRDFPDLLESLLTVLFWFSAIIIPISFLPKQLQSALRYNLFTVIINMLRTAMRHHMPSLHAFIVVAVYAVIFYVLYYALQKKIGRKFVYYM